MPSFTSGEYIPPGVYVEEEAAPLVSVVGTQPTVVAIAGPSVGYRTHTEAIVLTGTTPVSLAKLGIYGPASGVGGFQVTAADGTLYPTSDYTVTQAGGADGQIGTTEDNTTTIVRTGGSTITSGATVYVTYRYTDADYHAPLRVRDYDEVREAFGESIDLTTGAVISPLSLAAKVALENGAGQIVLVATEDAAATATTRVNLQGALAKLESLVDVSVIVPLPVGLTGTDGAPGDTENVGNDLKAHVEEMATEGLFRVGILGYETSVTRVPETLAAAYRSSRVMLAWPNRLSYYNGATNTMLEVAGYYLAAAYAGMLASVQPQTPLTKKQVRGFSGLPASMAATMSAAQKNTWSAAGVAVAEIGRDGRLTVRHGTTTMRDNVNTRELSLVRARDALVNLVQQTTERAGLVGTPISPETGMRVKSVVSGVLETAVNIGLIYGYNNLKVRSASADPSIIEVKFQYQPAYPLNYILIVFSVNTITGETNVLEVAA